MGPECTVRAGGEQVRVGLVSPLTGRVALWAPRLDGAGSELSVRVFLIFLFDEWLFGLPWKSEPIRSPA